MIHFYVITICSSLQNITCDVVFHYFSEKSTTVSWNNKTEEIYDSDEKCHVRKIMVLKYITFSLKLKREKNQSINNHEEEKKVKRCES